MASEESRTFFSNTPILVVDDDVTHLHTLCTLLKMWNYQVITALQPASALSTLRGNREKVNLIMISYDMHEMSGLELMEKILDEFQLPVIMILSRDDEFIILRSLAAGAEFCMVKPIELEQLKNVWLYTIKGRGRIASNLVKGSARSSHSPPSSSNINQCINIRDGNYELQLPHHQNGPHDQNPGTCYVDSNHEQQMQVQEQKQKPNQEHTGASPRKRKVIWTEELHHRFLTALSFVGIERATPQKILEMMLVPGLRRSQVSSHLQKYRNFLKENVDRSAAQWLLPSMLLPSMIGSMETTDKDILDVSIPRPLEAFQPNHPNLVLNHINPSSTKFKNNKTAATTSRSTDWSPDWNHHHQMENYNPPAASTYYTSTHTCASGGQGGMMKQIPYYQENHQAPNFHASGRMLNCGPGVINGALDRSINNPCTQPLATSSKENSEAMVIPLAGNYRYMMDHGLGQHNQTEASTYSPTKRPAIGINDFSNGAHLSQLDEDNGNNVDWVAVLCFE